MAKTVLVTGANGEMGHGLIPMLAAKGYEIIALDVADIDEELKNLVKVFIQTDILSQEETAKAIDPYHIETVFHLAAILSTGAEANPERAHEVNVNGTQNLLYLVKEKSVREDSSIKFIFPSSIAVYGMPSIEVKKKTSSVKEFEFLNPVTMYGINKLYCENLGRYYSKYYRLTSEEAPKGELDFRAIRFPGIISALTVPTGGTSDYAPEMIHSAAQGQGYESFVRPDTKIPFMVMPDAVKALVLMENADRSKLTQDVYNISAFSVTAEEIAEMVNRVFTDSAISYSPHPKRQYIVDTWPGQTDDTKAKNDWGWIPDFTLEKAFNEYLIPTISQKYKK